MGLTMSHLSTQSPGKTTCSSLKDQLPALMRPANSGVVWTSPWMGLYMAPILVSMDWFKGKSVTTISIIDHYIYRGYLQMFPSSTSGTMTELMITPWIWRNPRLRSTTCSSDKNQLSSHQPWWLQGESPVLLTSTFEQGNKLGKGRGNHHWRLYPHHIAGQSSRSKSWFINYSYRIDNQSIYPTFQMHKPTVSPWHSWLAHANGCPVPAIHQWNVAPDQRAARAKHQPRTWGLDRRKHRKTGFQMISREKTGENQCFCKIARRCISLLNDLVEGTTLPLNQQRRFPQCDHERIPLLGNITQW